MMRMDASECPCSNVYLELKDARNSNERKKKLFIASVILAFMSMLYTNGHFLIAGTVNVISTTATLLSTVACVFLMKR